MFKKPRKTGKTIPFNKSDYTKILLIKVFTELKLKITKSPKRRKKLCAIH